MEFLKSKKSVESLIASGDSYRDARDWIAAAEHAQTISNNTFTSMCALGIIAAKQVRHG